MHIEHTQTTITKYSETAGQAKFSFAVEAVAESDISDGMFGSHTVALQLDETGEWVFDYHRLPSQYVRNKGGHAVIEEVIDRAGEVADEELDGEVWG